MAATNTVNVIENSRVSPPAGTVPDQSLPLTYFDIKWLDFNPVHYLFFYELPHSTLHHFTEKIVPVLKNSLSVTLKHFFPFVSNIVVFPYPDSATKKMPEFRYTEGDSLSFVIAECSLDFNDLTGNHLRNADKFYPLVPQLGRAVKKPDNSLEMPAFAVQVTLFPNSGICIGMTNSHALCDASTKYDFIQAWASIARDGGDESFLATGTMPFYGRAIKEAEGLDKMIWNQVRKKGLAERISQPPCLVSPTNKVRATFIMTALHIKRFKEQVAAHRPALTNVSSFTIVCAYVRCCMEESRVAVSEEINNGDELELFIFSANARARLAPPLPATFFGNCMAPCFSFMKSSELRGKEAFLNAVESIKEAIHELVNNKGGILKDAETWNERISRQKHSRIIGVTATPKVKVYHTDFGWGTPKKCEVVSIDYGETMSLNTSRESDEDMEIGLCFPDDRMRAFATIFTEGLESML